MEIKKVSSGVKWEDIVGYSRAVRMGNIVEVAGTIAYDQDGKLVGLNDPYEQTKFIIQKAEKALKQLDCTLENVIRTRMYVTDISQWEEIGRAHGEFFNDIKPASTMVEVSKLVTADTLVEMEFSAICE
ncbi:MAG: RidA family protein [Bacteroidetes bacterium]|nr:RidA family protein [Bacteroidota bacterium]